MGLIKNLDDIRSIVLKEVGGTPVYIRDVGEVRFGEEVRYGAMIKGGYTESVGGIVMMVAAGNAKEIVSKIKARVEEINSKDMLPDGLQIVPYYDRSELVDAALHTVSKVLVEGIMLVIVILFLFLGDLRSSIIVIATLDPDTGAHVSGHEPLRNVGQPDVAGRPRDRDRPHGGRLGRRRGERVREAWTMRAARNGCGSFMNP